jgi:hypothetical protein
LREPLPLKGRIKCPVDGETCNRFMRPFSVSWNRALLLCAAAAVFLFMALIGALVAQVPEHTRGQVLSPEAREEKQDIEIATLIRIVGPLVVDIEDMRVKQGWMLGGVAGFGALLTLLNVMRLRK